ncbi:MAG: FecR family protein [Verrucomicrobiales bacterium]|nr:FecR family protein [Verrucomicrobiales bacterium]
MKKLWLSTWSSSLIIGLGMLSSISLSQDTVKTDDDFRTWTNTKGVSIQGKLINVLEGKALILVNGKEFAIPLTGLSDSDNIFIKEWQSRVSPLRITKLSVLRGQGQFEIVDKDGSVVGSLSEEDWIEPENPDLAELEEVTAKKVRGTQSKQIFEGQSIRTKADASVDLYSPTGAIIHLRPETELQLPEPKEVAPASSLELLKGSLFLKVDAKELQSDRKEFRLKSPTAILTVKGTEFFAKVESDSTISGVYEGQVEATYADEKIEDIFPGYVTELYDDRAVSREMSEEEKAARRVFDTLAVRKSSLADQAWGWNAFDWEVHSLLKEEATSNKQEISSINVQRGRNEAGNLAVEFRPIDEKYQYGEFRIDTVVGEPGEDLLGAEFRIRADRNVPLIITTLGADQAEKDRKKGGLLDRSGYEFLVEFHNLKTIQEHKTQYWGTYRLEDDQANLENDGWNTHFVPFSRNDYPETYDVKSWYIFLCLGPEVVATRNTVKLEIAPPVLVFDDQKEQ